MLILRLEDIVGLIALGLFLIVVLVYGIGYLFRSIKMKIRKFFKKGK